SRTTSMTERRPSRLMNSVGSKSVTLGTSSASAHLLHQVTNASRREALRMVWIVSAMRNCSASGMVVLKLELSLREQDYPRFKPSVKPSRCMPVERSKCKSIQALRHMECDGGWVHLRCSQTRLRSCCRFGTNWCDRTAISPLPGLRESLR